MKRLYVRRTVASGIIIAGLVLAALAWIAQAQNMPFGGKDDVTFAQNVWKAMDGYQNWLLRTDIMPGRSPHGKFIRTYFSILNFDGKHYHAIVKDNYGGQDVTLDQVKKSPDDYLMSVTVMVQREAGYDPDNQNWFWVKYAKDGTIDKNGQGVAMAGRVAKGMDKGCIACHRSAQGGDYFYTND